MKNKEVIVKLMSDLLVIANDLLDEGNALQVNIFKDGRLELNAMEVHEDGAIGYELAAGSLSCVVDEMIRMLP